MAVRDGATDPGPSRSTRVWRPFLAEPQSQKYPKYLDVGASTRPGQFFPLLLTLWVWVWVWVGGGAKPSEREGRRGVRATGAGAGAVCPWMDGHTEALVYHLGPGLTTGDGHEIVVGFCCCFCFCFCGRTAGRGQHWE